MTGAQTAVAHPPVVLHGHVLGAPATEQPSSSTPLMPALVRLRGRPPAFVRRAWNTSTKPRLHHFYTAVKTQDEKELFFELHDALSNGATTNWPG